MCKKESPDLAGIHESEQWYATWVGLYLKGIKGAWDAEGQRDAGLQIGVTCRVIRERAGIGAVPARGPVSNVPLY
jgi:hypothetical protein